MSRELDDAREKARERLEYLRGARAPAKLNRSQRTEYMECLSFLRRHRKINAEEIMLRRSLRYPGW